MADEETVPTGTTPPDPPSPEVIGTEAAAEAAAPADGPWAKDLAENFQDPALRAQVDTFLRGRVQPYTTQLETQLKAAEGAQALITDLQNNPSETFLALAHEMFGDDLTGKIRGALSDETPTPEAVTPEAPAAPETPTGLEDHPVLKQAQEWMDRLQAQDDEAAYNRELDALVAQDTSINKELLHPFVVASQGDLMSAVNGYKNWIATAQGAGLLAQAQATEAPQAVGSDTGGDGAAAPMQKTYQSLDSAMDDFFNENRAAPQAIGTV